MPKPYGTPDLQTVPLNLGKRLVLELQPTMRQVYLSIEHGRGRDHLVTIPAADLGPLIGALSRCARALTPKPAAGEADAEPIQRRRFAEGARP